MKKVERQEVVTRANDKLKMAAFMIEGSAIRMHKVADGEPVSYAYVHKLLLDAVNNLLFVAQEVTNLADGVEDVF